VPSAIAVAQLPAVQFGGGCVVPGAMVTALLS
jgi:hypothetical protein